MSHVQTWLGGRSHQPRRFGPRVAALAAAFPYVGALCRRQGARRAPRRRVPARQRRGAVPIDRSACHPQGAARRGHPDRGRQLFDRRAHASSPLAGRFRGMPRISEAFFWISRIAWACSRRPRRRAFSLRKRSLSLATGSRRRPWGPRGVANACNEPSRRARRQAASCEEYRPSRRSKAPTSPGAPGRHRLLPVPAAYTAH